MLKVKDLIKIIDDIAPAKLAMEGDKIGLQVGSANQEVTKVMLCLDATEDVVEQAAREGAELIISHHPLVYEPMQAVVDTSDTQRVVMNAIRKNISILVAHTNLDNADKGINDYLVGLVRGKKKEVLPDGNSRVGLVCNIDSIPLKELATHISACVGERVYVVGESMSITRIAVISGGGGGNSGYIDTAKQMGAQCLVTGDIKHHVCKHAQAEGMCLIDVSHFISEYSYLPVLKGAILELIKKQKATLAVEIASETNARRIV